MNTAMIARVLAALRAVKDSPPGQIPRDYWHACTLAHNELEAATHPQVIDKVDAERIATAVCQEVADLDDRNSPEDWPEAMLVTADELRAIVLAVIPAKECAP